MKKGKGKDGQPHVSGTDGLYSPLYSNGDTNPLGGKETPTNVMGKVGGPSGGKKIPDPSGLCKGDWAMPMPGMAPMPGPGMLGMGPSPMGGPEPGAMGGMDALMGASMGGRGEQALKDAAMAVGIALGDAYNRSAKAATMLSKALTLINQARQELQQASESAVGSPPELLGALMGQSPMGMPGGPSL